MRAARKAASAEEKRRVDTGKGKRGMRAGKGKEKTNGRMRRGRGWERKGKRRQ